MKIDIFPHIMPPKYGEALKKELPPTAYSQLITTRCNQFPALADLERRFSMMDKHEDMLQVLTLTVPFVEREVEPKVATELAKIGNDELAELVEKYPDRFVGAVGNLPMNDLEAALDELDRIMAELHFKGIQLATDINGKPLDSPEFMPLYEKMDKYGLPIWLHPVRPPTVTDYSSLSVSKYRINKMLGWPYDTSAAMVHLVLSQVLKKYPNVKFVTHHCGAMIPYFDRRVATFLSGPEVEEFTKKLDKSPIEYLKEFYNDTALNGSTAALMCGYAFFGADHIVFGTDMPLGSYGDHSGLDDVIQSIERMDIPAAEKEKIFSGNAKRLLKLQI